MQRPAEIRADFRAIGAVAVLAYFVLVADLSWVGLNPIVPIASAVLAAALITTYVRGLPGRSDRLDRAVLLALLLFAAAAALSHFLRLSLDSILEGLLLASGLFVARGILARESARRLFLAGFMALSTIISAMVAAQFVVPFLQWWALTDWRVFPPLDLTVVAQPWGLRHDITLLVVLLYPSWWVGNITWPRLVGALAVGTLVLLVCFIDGSRTIWLVAVLGAATCLGLPRWRPRWDMRWTAVVALGVAVLALMFVIVGVATPLVHRLLRVAPLAERGAMWVPLIQQWLSHPFTGAGPGSFPWLLQLTGYFDTNSFAPRQPDSAPVQLLAESGALGLAAAGVLLWAVSAAVFKGNSAAARFALVTATLAGLALNPTQISSVMAVVIAWVAFGTPREEPGVSSAQWTSGLREALSLGALAVVGVAFTSTMVAHVAYWSAGGSVARGAFGDAESSLRLAATLDPGLAIYQRQLGTVLLVSGRPGAATHALDNATRLNGSDDLAWRILGLAEAEAGNPSASLSAIRRAVQLQRSDPTNLLLLARAQFAKGDQAGAAATLAEVLQAWPTIVASPIWPDFSSPISTPQLLELAHQRWTEGQASPEPLMAQPLLLGIMIGEPNTSLNEERTAISQTLTPAYISVMRCDADAAAVLRSATDSDRRRARYWALAVREAKLLGKDPTDFMRLRTIMTGDSALSARSVHALNPLYENVFNGASADLAGYHREPFAWPATIWDLPSPTAGFARWYLDPAGSVRSAGIQHVLACCS